MIATIVLASVFWFYAVNTYETWFVPWGPTPNVERAMGGWAYSGPFKTRAECEKDRAKMKREPYRDYAHALRYDPQPCRSLTYEQYIRESQRLR